MILTACFSRKGRKPKRVYTFSPQATGTREVLAYVRHRVDVITRDRLLNPHQAVGFQGFSNLDCRPVSKRVEKSMAKPTSGPRVSRMDAK